jgi:hypothetical protein
MVEELRISAQYKLSPLLFLFGLVPTSRLIVTHRLAKDRLFAKSGSNALA